MDEDDKRFFSWFLAILILWAFTNELLKSVELARFHEANNLQLEYNKTTEAKLLELTNVLEIAVEQE